MKGISTPRMAINSATLFGFALISHVLAGGSFTTVSRLFAMALLIVFALFIFGRSVLSGPRLALLVLIVQSATHLILGEMTGNSFAMSISHILGGIASFTLLTKSDEFWFAVKKLVLHIVSPKILTLPQIKLREFKVFYRDLACWFSVLLTSSNGLRAPPNSLSKGIFA